ncbi:MAG: hypothetical protein AAGI11_15300 [Pseudomonadota bacterium]
MADNTSTGVLAELKTVLSGIGGDSYLTDLGQSVHRGFYSHVLRDANTKFPAAVIHPPTEEILSVQGGNKSAMLQLTIPIILAAPVGDDDKAYDQISDCLRDARRAIFRGRDRLTSITNDEAMTIGAAEPDMSADSLHVLAAFTLNVTFTESYT